MSLLDQKVPSSGNHDIEQPINAHDHDAVLTTSHPSDSVQEACNTGDSLDEFTKARFKQILHDVLEKHRVGHKPDDWVALLQDFKDLVRDSLPNEHEFDLFLKWHEEYARNPYEETVTASDFLNLLNTINWNTAEDWSAISEALRLATNGSKPIEPIELGQHDDHRFLLLPECAKDLARFLYPSDCENVSQLFEFLYSDPDKVDSSDSDESDESDADESDRSDSDKSHGEDLTEDIPGIQRPECCGLLGRLVKQRIGSDTLDLSPFYVVIDVKSPEKDIWICMARMYPHEPELIYTKVSKRTSARDWLPNCVPKRCRALKVTELNRLGSPITPLFNKAALESVIQALPVPIFMEYSRGLEVFAGN